MNLAARSTTEGAPPARRWGLRVRVTVAFALLSLVVVSALSVVSFVLAQRYLIQQRERSATRQAFLNARLVRDSLIDPSAAPADALALLERAGHGVWRHVQVRAARLLPIDSAPKALLAGAAWGWLPCGLVYSTLAWTASSASAPRGALLMLAFGVGTMPAVIASGVLAAQLRALLHRRGLRIVAGLLVIAFGTWTLAVVLLAGGHDRHPHH